MKERLKRLSIDVNKLPLETYTQLIMIRAVNNNLDTLEDVIVMLTNYYWNDEREDN